MSLPETCAWQECNEPRYKNSRYCKAHKADAFKARIKRINEEKAARNAAHLKAFCESIPIEDWEPYMPYGAWFLIVRPPQSSFARWLVATGRGFDYRGATQRGVAIRVYGTLSEVSNFAQALEQNVTHPRPDNIWVTTLMISEEEDQNASTLIP